MIMQNPAKLTEVECHWFFFEVTHLNSEQAIISGTHVGWFPGHQLLHLTLNLAAVVLSDWMMQVSGEFISDYRDTYFYM